MTGKNFLIDSWFPFGEVSVESIRERSPGTDFPAPNRLHVWFARRPLTTSRATVLCSLIKNKNREKILNILGIPPYENLLEAQRRMDNAKSTKIRIENPFTWKKSYNHTPTDSELEWLHTELKKVWGGKLPTVMDPMAGGGSIPLEAMRLGLPVIASDLNPVAFLIQKATVEYPAKFGEKLIPAVEEFCNEVHKRAYDELKEYFLKIENKKVFAYLWARTITCEKCNLIIPLSPNWYVFRKGVEEKEIAVKLKIPTSSEGDVCSFEIIKNPKKEEYDPNDATDNRKEALCPRCKTKTSGDSVKKQAREGKMGHQIYAVCTKKYVGPKKQSWDFEVPTQDQIKIIKFTTKKFESKIQDWKKQGLVPEQDYFKGFSDRCSVYGVSKWTDLFNSRQLLTHLTYLEKFLEVKEEWLKDKSKDKEFVKAVCIYFSIVFDTCVDYNCQLSLWDPTMVKVAHAMSIQSFPFKTSYAEWNQLIEGGGFEWALKKITKCMQDLHQFMLKNQPTITIKNQDSSKIPLENKSIESVIVDPPYGENVMYGEVADFFYVWLKKMVGDLFPDEFKNELSDKDAEAVANSSLYRDAGRGQAKKLADQHYQSKLEACFKEMNRVLVDNGVLTVMFTHRKSEAWSGLTRALMNAGFTFKSSWAVATEPGQKFGKRDKGVLKRTVLLACKKRTTEKKGLWSKVKEELYAEAQSKVKEYSDVGITGPDLLVCTYGPVLGKFGDYSLVKDSSGNTKGPEDALDLVAEAVNKFTTDIPGSDIETMAYVNLITSFPELIIDEDDARVTVMFGGNLSISDLVDKGLVDKKGSKVTILTSKQRLDSGVIDLGKPENLKSLIDVVHACLITFEKQGIKAVKKLLEDTGKDSSDSGFVATLKAISSLRFDVSGKSAMSDEIKTVNSLLEALGLEPESVLKKGEKITHYPKESLDDF